VKTQRHQWANRYSGTNQKNYCRISRRNRRSREDINASSVGEDAAASVGKVPAESVRKIATSSIAEVAAASVFEGVSNIDRPFFKRKRRKDNGATVLDGTV